MSSYVTTAGNKQANSEEINLNKEFDEFFNYCKTLKLTKKELNEIYSPLQKYLNKLLITKLLKITLIIFVIIFLCYYVDFLNWNIAAIGRICLIKLLPFWNWRALYGERCLIKANTDTGNRNSLIIDDEITLNDCDVCENYDQIDYLSDVTYDYVNDKYLLRGLPAIITDSENINFIQNQSFIEYLLTFNNIKNSAPCYLKTNLLLLSENNKNLNDLFQLILRTYNVDDKWFLLFENCYIDVVKSFRLIVRRPYYYSTHLDSPTTVWILISQNYNFKNNNENLLKTLPINYGFINIYQIKGKINFYLQSRGDCKLICGEYKITLYPGETLIFINYLWEINYSPETFNQNNEIVTIITQTHWRP